MTEPERVWLCPGCGQDLPASAFTDGNICDRCLGGDHLEGSDFPPEIEFR